MYVLVLFLVLLLGYLAFATISKGSGSVSSAKQGKDSDYLGRLFAGVLLFSFEFFTYITTPTGCGGGGRIVRAISEIESIELALSAMLADTEQSSLGDLFNTVAVNQVLDTWSTRFPQGNPLHQENGTALGTLGRQKAALKLYTSTAYALLRDGRGALAPKYIEKELNGLSYAEILNVNLIKRLGTNYLPDIQNDPWGKLYNIYPGPWDAEKDGSIPFRSFSKQNLTMPIKETKATNNIREPDIYSKEIENPNSGKAIMTSFPSNSRKASYIWSNGANGENNQVLGILDSHYKTYATDDINNWDSNSTWTPFYPGPNAFSKSYWEWLQIKIVQYAFYAVIAILHIALYTYLIVLPVIQITDDAFVGRKKPNS